MIDVEDVENNLVYHSASIDQTKEMLAEIKVSRALRGAIGSHQLAIAGGLGVEAVANRIGDAIKDYDRVCR